MASITSAKRSAREPDSSPEARQQARRLVQEGLLIRYANLQRRFAGGKNAVKLADLATSPLVRKVSEGWRVTEEGFVRAVVLAEAQHISKLLNAEKDDLGVYSCVREDKGYRLVFEF